MGEHLEGVEIGVREIYDAVLGLRIAVDRLTDRHVGIHTRIDDHECRLRSLEGARWPLPALAVAVAAISLGVSLLPDILG